MSVANTNNRNGFSLIELMVVITIVGILSGVSVSTYRGYAAKARIVSIINVLQSWQQKAIEYANLHGHFPNSTELNLAVPSSISQYVTSMSNDGGDSCGAMGWVGFTLNPATIGISNPDITDVGIYLVHYHTVDNKIGSLCSPFN